MIMKRKKNGQNGHDVAARLQSMRTDLDALQDDVRGLLNDVGGVASDRVQGAMTSAMHSAQGAADRVEAWGNGRVDGMRKTFRKRPLAACALSIGAGAVLGALFWRR